MNYIANWNGATWSALGTGMSGSVYALAVDTSGSKLYAGGSFTTAGGVSAPYAAQWDLAASTWSSIGSFNTFVYSMAVSGPDLYIGGYFMTAGGGTANRLAKWDGTTLTGSKDVMLNSSIMALAASGTNLYAGGSFSLAGTNLNSTATIAANVVHIGLALGTPTTTTLASSLNPSAYGSSVTFTSTVTPVTASGTVAFKDGAATLDTVALSAGKALFTTNGLGVGAHTLTAVYSGDATNAPSTSGALTQTVNKLDPGVTTWPTATAITYGQTLADSSLSGGAASVPGDFAFTTPSTAPGAGVALQGVTFTPTDTANYNTASGSASVTVYQAATTVTNWPTASTIALGQALSASTLTGGSASVPGSFVFDSPATVPPAGTNSATVVFVPGDAANYLSVTGAVNVIVLAPPAATTLAATAILSASATLNGSINPGGLADAFIQYGTTTSFGSRVRVLTGATGNNVVPCSLPLTGLAAGTTYYFQALATNIAGTVSGDILNFTTPSTNAALASLAVSVGTLAPVFAPGTLIYTVAAPSAPSLTVTPTAAQANAAITVNGTPVPSGTASDSISLVPGPNSIAIAVTAQDGITVLTYTVIVNPAASSATTVAASATNSVGATLNGNVNPGGLATAYFQLGKNPNFFGAVTTVAGDGTRGFADGPVATAQFNNPQGVVMDAAGNIFVADSGNQRIRRITPAGVVSTVAGAGVSGFANGPGATALFDTPYGVTVDAAGNLYVSDELNDCIRKVAWDGTTWQVTTFAGSGTRGYQDGDPASAQFDRPQFLTVDAAGNVYVADKYNNCIRKITVAGGVATDVTTLPGKGSFTNPRGVAVDSSGNVYVGATDNQTLVKITPGGVVSTLAGSGVAGFADGLGVAAQFNQPRGVAVDGAGNLYVGDTANNRIRKVTPAGYALSMAGSSVGFADSPDSDTAEFDAPYGVAVDAAGNVYVADKSNQRIRKVSGTLAAVLARKSDSTAATNLTGAVDVPVNLPVTGLEHETTYYYRVMGSNSLGIAYGAALSFTTYSTNALLQYLAVNNGAAPLSPNFDPYVTNYTITVPTSAVSVTIDAIGHQDDFTNDLYTVVLQVTNVTVANPVPLAVSGATTITIVVTAQDGVTTCAYSVLVTRAASVPVTVTLAADPIGATNATLRASVNPNSLSAAAGAAFQYSTQPVFGSGAWIVVASGIYNSRYQYVVGGEDGGIAVDGSGTIYTTYNNRFEVIRVNSAGVATNLVQPFDYQSDPYTGNSYTDAYSMGGVAVNRDGTAIYTARSSVSKSTFKGIEKWQGSGVTWNYDRSRPTSIPPWYPVLDEATGDLYVTCKTYYSGTMQPGKLVRIDGTTKAATYLTLTYVGSPTPASINSPVWMVRDSAGALYFTDESTYNSGYTYTLRKATQNGSSWAVSTLATLPSEPKGLAMDSSGTIYVTYGGSAYSMSAPTWQPTQLVPGPNITGSKTLTDMTVDSNGNLYLVESSADPGRILKYSPGPAMLTAKLDGGADATGLTGTSDVAVNLPLTNLTAGTKYYFRAVATNSGGTANGEVLSFTTVSGDATLKSLALSAGTLTPTFDPATTTYTATVPTGTTTLTVTPTVNQTNATLTVNGHAAVSGAAYGPISLAIGDNIITIVVTASDSTTDTYKVTVTRPVGAPVAVSVAVDPTTIRSTEATLLGTLDANGAPSVAGFFQFGTNASISTGADFLPAKEGSAEDPTSPLPVQLRVTNLVSETTYYYRVVGTNDYGTNYGATLSFITLSTNANLAGLAASVGSLTPAFASGTTDYTVTVSNAPASTTITPTVSQTNATVTVNGTAVVSGAASAPISLVVGDNPITVVVTAQDGLTTRTYNVTVTKLRVPVTFTAQPAGVTLFSEANTTNYITVAASASSWTNVARVAGAPSPVSFQATAWGSDTPFTYQWYQNGAPLAGQTSNVLTVAVDASTAGAAFQIVATDSSSVSATSTVATLTVEQASTSIAYAFDQAATGHSSTNWQQTGNANWANDTGGFAAMPKRMRLTAASSSQNSSFWYNPTALNAGRSWRFSWTFQGGFSGNPADVCSFVLQADGTNAVVRGPDATTLSGLTNRFLSIAIDDYKNTEDPSGSTLKVTYGTNTSQTQFPVVNLATAFTNSSQAPGLSTTSGSAAPPYNLTATYFALSNQLTITLANTTIPGGAPGGTNNPLTYTYTLNLSGLFGTNKAWAGFAGSTGGASQIHDVLNANGLFSSENNQPPIVVTPITTQSAIYNAAFSFTFPEGTFVDPDGNPLSYTATGLPPGILFDGPTRTFAGTPTAAGSNSVSLVASDGQSPPLSATNIFSIVVAKAPATVSLGSLSLSQIYDAIGKPVFVTTDPVGLAVSVTYDGSAVIPTTVGSRTAVAIVTDPNYRGTNSATAQITRKALTVQGITAASTIYDGTTTAKLGGMAALLTVEAPGAGNTSDGKPYTGDDVTLGGTAAGTLALKDVGARAVTITGNTISGAQAGNYTLTQQTGLTQAVTAKALTVQGITAASTIYDGTNTAKLGGTAALLTAEGPGPGTTGDGAPYTGDDVTLGGAPAGILASKDVGTRAVTITGNTISGAQAGNYTLTQQIGLTQVIAAKALTVSGITAASTIYDGTTVAKLGGSAQFPPAEEPGTGTTGDGKPYTVDSVAAGGTPVGTLGSKDVGTNNVTIIGVTVTGTGNGNYTATQQTGLTQEVTPKALTAQGTLSVPPSKVYDRTTNAAVSGAAALQTAEAGGFGNTSDGKPYTDDEVSLTGTASYGYNSRNVLEATVVNENGLSLTGAQMDNYTLTAPSLAATITPKPLNLTANWYLKVYGHVKPYGPGQTAFTTGAGELVSGDAVTSVTLDCAGSLATAMVGRYDIIPSAAVGTILSNYAISYHVGAMDVGTRWLNITANADAKTYGQTKTYGPGQTAFSTGAGELVNGDSVASVTLACPDGGPATAVVGSYHIISSAAVGTGLVNYAINYHDGALTVNPRALNITANPDTKTYGEVKTYGPGQTAFSTGAGELVNGDSVTSVTLACPDGGPASAVVGSYHIIASVAVGSAVGNYSISYHDGMLTVQPANLVTTLVSSGNPSVRGSNVTFTATVTPVAPATTTPTGGVQFYTNGVACGSPVPLSGGVARVTLALFQLGYNHVAATNVTDGNYVSSDASLDQLVEASARTPITTDIRNNGNRTVTVYFLGTPNVEYVVEASQSLIEPVWDNISTNLSGSNGRWTIDDSTVGQMQRFYRVVKP